MERFRHFFRRRIVGPLAWFGTVVVSRLAFGLFLFLAVVFLFGGFEACSGEERAEERPAAAAEEPLEQQRAERGVGGGSRSGSGAAAAEQAAPEPGAVTASGPLGAASPGSEEPSAGGSGGLVARTWSAGVEVLRGSADLVVAAAGSLHRGLERFPAPMVPGLYFALCLGFLWLAGRSYVYQRYRVRSAARQSLLPTKDQPLPSQRRVIQDLKEIVSRRSPDDVPLLVALQGGWGSGKSFILHTFQAELDHEQPKAVVVSVDIWRHSTEPDLHLALFEALLSHPRVPPFPSFFRYPLALLPVILLRYATKVFARGRIEVGKLRVAFTLPTLLWQRSLEDTVSCLRRRDVKVVWVLDEIDRCSVEMAQSAVSLARRALNLPGTVVVLPFVPEQMRYKVFNPMQGSRPDIHSTLQAVIWDQAVRQDPTLSLESAMQVDDDLWEVGWHPGEMQLPGVGFAGGSDKEGGVGRAAELAGEPVATLKREFDWRLARLFARYRPGVRSRLFYLFEEKYLSFVIAIPDLEMEEIAHVALGFHTVRGYVDEIYRRNGMELDDAERKEIRRAMVTALRDFQRVRTTPSRAQAPMIRHLEGTLIDLLRATVAKGDHLQHQVPSGVETDTYLRTCLVMLLLLAYQRAWEIIQKRT